MPDPITVDPINPLGGDRFEIGGSIMSLAQAVMLMELDRSNIMKAQLVSESQYMDYLRDVIAELNDAIERVRKHWSTMSDGSSVNFNSTLPTEKNVFTKHGITFVGTTSWVSTKDQVQLGIENLKAFTEEVQSKTQLTLTNVSEFLKKASEALTHASSTNQDLFGLKKNIIGSQH